jgi:predicted MPP superfamily phosphohydrolase
MKILILSDLHLGFYNNPINFVKGLKKYIVKNNVDLVLIAGDTLQGTMTTKPELEAAIELLSTENVKFVFGNHDLWQRHPDVIKWSNGLEEFVGDGDELQLPPVNYLKTLKTLGDADKNILEKDITSDSSTYFKIDDCLVVGTMGFPDFLHPHYISSQVYFDRTAVTNDQYHVDLSKGYQVHTEKMIGMFEKRIKKAVEENKDCKNLIVVSHYPCFESQSSMRNDYSSPYYFCHSLGQVIREVADDASLRILAVAGHAHVYNRGQMLPITDNVQTIGVKTDYMMCDGYIVNLNKDGFKFKKVCKL